MSVYFESLYSHSAAFHMEPQKATFDVFPFFAMIGSLTAWVSSGFIRERVNTLESSLEQLIKNAQGCADAAKISNELSTWMEQYWKHFSLPEKCMNARNRKVIEARLLQILTDHPTQSPGEKMDICLSVCTNAIAFLSSSEKEIEHDLRTDLVLQRTFQVHSSDEVVSIMMLGEETHNKGQVPLLVELKSGTKIVYKPRSMRVEEVVFGRQNSLFSRLNLSAFTYPICDFGTHGYCYYLENNPEENTFLTTQEVEQYLQRFCILEKYARALGLSDLHQENLLVSNKVPYIIDAEVVAPVAAPCFQTGLLSGLTAGYLFTSDTKNRIWFGRALLDRLEKADVKKIEKNDFGALDAVTFFSDLEALESLQYKETAISEEEACELKKTASRLSKEKNRIVLIGTETLRDLIKESLKSSTAKFLQELEEGVETWGFELDSRELKHIEEAFIEDVKNNDTPIFYYRARDGALFYHDIQIAQRHSN